MKGTLGYKVRTISCVACGEVVTGHMPAGQRYCSLSCYRNSPRPVRKTGRTVNCSSCGMPVYVPRCRADLDQPVLCDRACFARWHARHKTTHVCTICRKTFRWSPSRQKTYNIRYCSLACRNADPARREQLIRMNLKQQQGKRTIPEVIGYALLDELGIPYLPQHLIASKFCVDAFSPSLRLVIQFDGDCWHGHPARFPKPDKRQQRRMKLDRSQDAYMKKCGYHVIRLWETDLKKDPESVKERLLPFATQLTPTPSAPVSGPPEV